MNAVLAFLVARWFLTFVGTALFAVLLWFFGPFLEFLESWVVRLVLIVAMFAIWLGANLLLDWRRRRREAALVEGVAAAAPDPTVTASAEEVAALRDKLTAALDLLKRARGTKGYLYEQPWYAIIGPPGAGKTTALLNAGLRFPLAAEMGQSAVAGVGGTRLCEWWFTEEAVLIDTAGRYTTQDSDEAVDRAGWEGFLDLLKRTRLRQPLNGLIVAMPLTELATAPREERLRACPGDPAPHQGNRGAAGDPAADLRAFYQGRSARRLHRVFRRSRPRKARPGVGRDVSADDARSRPGERLRRRIPAADRAAEQPPFRSAPGRAQPAAAQPDRRLRLAGGKPGSAARRVPAGGFRRLAARPRPDAARLLFHLGHAGRGPRSIA